MWSLPYIFLAIFYGTIIAVSMIGMIYIMLVGFKEKHKAFQYWRRRRRIKLVKRK